MSASPEAVWDLVTDVGRVGEWSGECRGCAWIGDVPGPVPGARFRGRNRRGGFRWSRRNVVVTADRPHTFVWRTVARPPYPDTVEWHIRLTEDPHGTRVTLSFDVLRMPRLMEWVISVAVPAHRDRSADLAADLRRLESLLGVTGATGS